jgi:hypothetical protein
MLIEILFDRSRRWRDQSVACKRLVITQDCLRPKFSWSLKWMFFLCLCQPLCPCGEISQAPHHRDSENLLRHGE